MIGHKDGVEGRRAHENEPIEFIYLYPSHFNPNFSASIAFRLAT